MEVEIFLSELWLGAQRQVDLHVAVLHPLGWKVILRLRQRGRQRHSLCHGLLVVTAFEIVEQVTKVTHLTPKKHQVQPRH